MRWLLLALSPVFLLMGVCSVSIQESIEVCNLPRDAPTYEDLDVVDRRVIPPSTTCDFIQEDGSVVRRTYPDPMAGALWLFGTIALACLFGFVVMTRNRRRDRATVA